MNKLRITIVIVTGLMTASCTKEVIGPVIDTFDSNYMPVINPGDFVSVINNPMRPFSVGSTFTFTATTDEGIERTEIEVLAETKVVMGVTCTVVRDIVYLNDVIIEDTRDWYAQDLDGNVWYFGEDVDNYVNGILQDHHGAWEGGVDGAQPGIAMMASPLPGMHYRQEFYEGEAEDRGEVVSLNETVVTPAGTFTGCVKIRETTPLDNAVVEYKYYAPGVGVVLEQADDEEVKIISYNIN